ncbi:MAG TPA: EscR/YscR/HrcR family type III secretion system export apparatus protein [Leucothrix mucor]|uniref:EscR/YscR/HrcR family type III secretion system export apparatus protein n=1 Tax=Leucothrix mucor TaxID=45248 RepID=A0A7V2SZV6_LEUMU|nr:EscR/YscR/HrcR family type III secretion system export apparatus protein [Leucothrix mucor]
MDSFPNPIILISALTLLGLAPFLAILTTSFVKIVIVIHMVRSALGLQQAPPNLAINGLAIILSMYVMAPVLMEAHERFNAHDVSFEDIKNPDLQPAIEDAFVPFKMFLIKHSNQHERNFFVQTTKKIWPKKYADKVNKDNLLILVPAFLISELTSAFQIGFLLYLPFIIIDLIISNILISMGMIMVSPIIISLPFKVLLFVLVDGWVRLMHGLILSYQ